MKAALEDEADATMSWKPQRCVEVVLQMNVQLDFSWKREQLIRGYTAHLAVQDDVTISQTYNKTFRKFRASACLAHVVIDWQPQSGLWKLKKHIEHCNDNYCQPLPVGGSTCNGRQSCASACTPHQVAHIVMEEEAADPNIAFQQTSSLVSANNILRREPSISHFRADCVELVKHINVTRCVDMTALEGYAGLFTKCGYSVKFYVVDGNENEKINLKAAKHISQQLKRGNSIPNDTVFQKFTVNMDDVSDDGRCYSGTFFVPNVSKTFVLNSRITTAVDAAHCDRVSPKCYFTTFVLSCHILYQYASPPAHFCTL